MKPRLILAAVALAAVTATPALASGWSWWGGKKPPHSSTSSGSGVTTTSSSGGATPVPEPATIGLLGLGVATLVARRRARRS